MGLAVVSHHRSLFFIFIFILFYSLFFILYFPVSSPKSVELVLPRDAHVHRFADVMVALVEHHHLALFCAAIGELRGCAC